MSGTKLFVGNIPNGTSKDELSRLFSKYGEILEVTIVKNFGFIHMSSEEEANHAIEVLDGTEFAGNIINVEISHGGKDKRPRDDRRILPRKPYGRNDERDSRDGYRSSRYEGHYSNNDRTRHRDAPHNPLEMLSGRPDLPIAASMLAATLLNPNTLSLLQNMANIRNMGNREENGNREERRYSRRSPPRTDRYSSSRHRSRSDRSPDRSYSRRH